MSKITQKQNSLIVAYEKAAEILRSADSAAICSKTGATYEGDVYRVLFMQTTYEIQMPGAVFLTEGIPTIVEVLILHYLTSAGDEPTRGEYIGFSGIPNGMFYLKSFKKRALDRLKGVFQDSPGKLVAAGAALGGKKWSAGDYSSCIPVFPKVNLVVQIFEADDEFPAEANILFSDNVVNFLPAEDVAFLGGYLVGALSRSA